MSKNIQIILDEINAVGLDFEYDGTNLNTFMQWKTQGMSVIKGEKALLTVPLWTPYQSKEKDSEGNVKTVTKFMLKKASLFSAEQVQPIKEPKAKKAKKAEKSVKAPKVKKAVKVPSKTTVEKVKEIVAVVTENLSNDEQQMSLF